MRATHAARAALLALAIGACGPSETTTQPSTTAPSAATSGRPVASAARSADVDFRKSPPAPNPEIGFDPPHIEEAKLSNGIRVLIVAQRGLPIVGVNISADVGADTSAGPGVGAFATSMLMRGTTTRDAIKLGDDIEAIGANVETFGDFDTFGVGGKCLTSTLPALLDIMADIAMHPAFDKKEIAREKSRRLTIIATQADRAQTLLSNAISEMLYPTTHPYSHPLIGDAASVKGIKREELVDYAQRMNPQHVTISVAGNVKTDVTVAALEKAFGGWAAPANEVTLTSPALDAKKAEPGARVLLIDRPDAPQSSMSFVAIGAPRSTPDFDALTVMNTIFGGQFSSRLNLNLREAHAYTYGARSGFEYRHGPGPFSAGGEIVREKSGAAAKEMLTELERLRSEPISVEELSDAKATLIEALPARFETAGATASAVAGLGVFKLPLDEYATRPARWSKITAEDVQRVAKKYLDAGALILVVVGDAKVVKAQLEELHIGDVVVRSAPTTK